MAVHRAPAAQVEAVRVPSAAMIRDNKEPFGARGCEAKFQLTPMRSIRLEMFGNTLNPGNHLVELIAR